MEDDNNKVKVSALSWLYEMEVLQSPVIMTNLKENILLAHENIKDSEILIFQEHKQILIYLEIDWKAKLFKKHKEISSKVEDIITTLLPSFKNRVVFDKNILTLALKKAKEIYGGSNEDIGLSNDVIDTTTNPTSEKGN